VKADLHQKPAAANADKAAAQLIASFIVTTILIIFIPRKEAPHSWDVTHPRRATRREKLRRWWRAEMVRPVYSRGDAARLLDEFPGKFEVGATFDEEGFPVSANGELVRPGRPNGPGLLCCRPLHRRVTNVGLKRPAFRRRNGASRRRDVWLPEGADYFDFDIRDAKSVHGHISLVREMMVPERILISFELSREALAPLPLVLGETGEPSFHPRVANILAEAGLDDQRHTANLSQEVADGRPERLLPSGFRHCTCSFKNLSPLRRPKRSSHLLKCVLSFLNFSIDVSPEVSVH
jgi:hypothetical protein